MLIQLNARPNVPWVSHGKHLGNTIENKINDMKMDIISKRANYIQKSNEIMQEFSFSHPKTKIEINCIFNNHFTGSPLWDLFSREAEMIYNSWNKSIRIMLGVPLNTHRFFLEPLPGLNHLKFTLVARFLAFISQIEKSQKMLPKILLQLIKRDCRFITGSNLRNILLVSNKDDLSQLTRSYIKNMEYMPVPEQSEWKINMLSELINVKWGEAVIEGFEAEQIDALIEEISTC